MTGEEFRSIRKELGLTQAALAVALKVHPFTVWRYENNRSPIPVWIRGVMGELLMKKKEGY